MLIKNLIIILKDLDILNNNKTRFGKTLNLFKVPIKTIFFNILRKTLTYIFKKSSYYLINQLKKRLKF
jgi:hypothetical protein